MPRVDDRRVISGIVHVLKSGCRWKDAPVDYGPHTRQHPRQGASLGCRWKRGASRQAIGISRGGRSTKLHAVCDGHGRPLTFLLTGGNAADAPQALALLQAVPEGAIVMADKAYDANAIRRFTESRNVVPNIPFKTNRRWKGCFSP